MITTSDYWWKLRGVSQAKAISGTLGKLDQEQGYRAAANLSNLRLYSNFAVLGLGGNDYAATEELLTPNRLTLNVVQSIVDTAEAMIADDMMRIKFRTSGGTYRSQKQSEDLTTFVGGQFYQTGFRALSPQIFKDGCIFGDGFLKIFEEADTIAIERVFPNEIKVDDLDGRYGKPQTLYHCKEVSKAYLQAKYPKKAEAIGAVFASHSSGVGSSLTDPVTFTEAWHLPSIDGGKDGCHAMVVGDVSLLDDTAWQDPFPIAKFPWNPRPLGYFAQGIPEQVKGIQIEINYILRKIQQHMTLNAAHLMVPAGANFNNNQWNNKALGRIDYSGEKPPTIQVVDAISPQYAQMLEGLYQKAFELTGISQLSAQSRKPAGIDSGKGLRELVDIQSRRFKRNGKRWQQFYLDVAQHMIRLAKRIDERGNGSYKILAEKNDALVELRWKDVNIDEADYIMTGWPANLLPETPGGQKQDAIEMLEGGLLTPEEGLELLGDFEDVKAIVKRKTAPRRLIEKIISQILDGGAFIAPEPYMDLLLGFKEMQNAYIEYSMLDVSKEKLSMMRDWIDQAKYLIEKAEAEMAAKAAATQAGAGGMPPGGMPAGPEMPPGVPGTQPVMPPPGVPGALQ